MPRLKIKMDINNALKNIEERGYSLSEMSEIERKIKRRRQDWKHNFDQYIHILLQEDPNLKAKNIVQRAEQLADAREELLDHKFEDDIIE